MIFNIIIFFASAIFLNIESKRHLRRVRYILSEDKRSEEIKKLEFMVGGEKDEC